MKRLKTMFCTAACDMLARWAVESVYAEPGSMYAKRCEFNVAFWRAVYVGLGGEL